MVGNDIVDLGRPRTHGLERNAPFLERVFAASERERILQASDPRLELWRHWAAKEAAFKAVTKLVGAPPIFTHRRFVVSWDPPGEAHRSLTHTGSTPDALGWVRYEELLLPIAVLEGEGGAWIHVVAVASSAGRTPIAWGRVAALSEDRGPPEGQARGPDGVDEAVRRHFTEREADAIHSAASAQVRLGARAELASVLAVEEGRLELVCAPGHIGMRPPQVLLDGLPAAVDVSLSHDGGWVAWAIGRD